MSSWPLLEGLSQVLGDKVPGTFGSRYDCRPFGFLKPEGSAVTDFTEKGTIESAIEVRIFYHKEHQEHKKGKGFVSFVLFVVIN